MHFRLLVSTLLLATLFIAPVEAQLIHSQRGIPINRPNMPKKTTPEIDKKALRLLDQVIVEADMLKLAENRLRVQATAASLLWTRDEARARVLFKTATNGLVELINALDEHDPQFLNLLQASTQLRQEMMQLMAQRDGELALEFLRATHLPARPQEGRRYSSLDEEQQLELGLASQIAAQNPKLALQIAEAGLSKGVSYQTTNIIYQLQNKDPEAAASFMDKVLKKIESENLLNEQEASGVAMSLLNMLAQTQNNRAPRKGGDGQTSGNSSTQNNLAAYRELLDTILNAALNAPIRPNGSGSNEERNAAQNLLMGLQQILPEIEKNAPARFNEVQRKIADFKKTLDPQSRRWSDFQQMIQQESVDAALVSIEKAPPEIRSNLYQQIAWKAFSQGDQERARQIVNDHVENAAQRQQLIDNMDQQSASQAAGEGKIEEAHQFLSRLHTKEERVSLLVQLASAAAQKKDQKLQRRLLDEALAIIGGKAETYNQMQAQLNVANSFAELDATQSLQILDGLVNQFNDLMSAAEVLNGFEQQYFRDGELVWQSSQLSGMISQHINSLALISRKDLAQTIAIAGKFQRPEARIMARLQIAQYILAQEVQMEDDSTIEEGVGSNQ
jgi:hypothetical protein